MNILHFGHHYVRPGPAPGPTATPERLEGQILALKGRGYHFLTCSEIVERITAGLPLPELLANLTFDDGVGEHAATVLPLLQKHGVPATFGVITCTLDLGGKPKYPRVLAFQYLIEKLGAARIEHELLPATLAGSEYAYLLDPNQYDMTGKKPGEAPEFRRIKQVYNHMLPESLRDRTLDYAFRQHPELGDEATVVRERFMSVPQLQEMQNAGMDIVSHSHEHRDYTRMDIPDLRSDVATAKERLSDVLNGEVRAFIWPFGADFSSEAEATVLEYHTSAWNFRFKLKEMPEDPYTRLGDIPRLSEKDFPF